jgi:hypothetical protein
MPTGDFAKLPAPEKFRKPPLVPAVSLHKSKTQRISLRRRLAEGVILQTNSLQCSPEPVPGLPLELQ